MLLNQLEYALMNNLLRASIQRRFEAPRLLRMGGPLSGGVALEIGCGRGVGIESIISLFQPSTVDGFDLDERMVSQARRRLSKYRDRTRLWVGDATHIPCNDQAYDAVFDFGVIHHIPHWRDAIAEIRRVLKPGGRLYGEEVLARVILNPIIRRLFRHPLQDRFGAEDLRVSLTDLGFSVQRWIDYSNCFAWFIVVK